MNNKTLIANINFGNGKYVPTAIVRECNGDNSSSRHLPPLKKHLSSLKEAEDWVIANAKNEGISLDKIEWFKNGVVRDKN